MGAVPADGFYPLMTFEESITCWEWPRRKYDESFSDQRDKRGKHRIIQWRVMCILCFLDSAFIFWPCLTLMASPLPLQKPHSPAPHWCFAVSPAAKGSLCKDFEVFLCFLLMYPDFKRGPRLCLGCSDSGSREDTKLCSMLCLHWPPG